MRFSEYYDQIKQRSPAQADAADLPGMSDRTFRRYSKRFEADGADGLLDRRIATIAHNCIPVDKIDELIELFESQYSDFTCKHFHGEAGQKARFQTQLQPGAGDATGQRQIRKAKRARCASAQVSTI